MILVEPVKAEPPKDAKPSKPQQVATATAAPPPPKDPLFGLRQTPAVSGAIVALDPHTGRVLAMTGGFSYEMSQFNRAIQAKRQTGSAIKPFIYMSAFDRGYTPSTVVLDAPITVDMGPDQPPWMPKNYDNKVFGPTTIRVGLEQSHDLMTVRLGVAIGLDAVGGTVEKFGIMDRMPREPSMLLGAGETTVLKLTTAYAMIVNGGKRITPSFIDRVQDRNGGTVYRVDQRPCGGCSNVAWTNQDPPQLPDNREQIEDPTTAYQIVHILEGVVERGTGRTIASIGKPLAGKTGTSNGPNDTWFVGFSPNLAVGVVVGFDQPVPLGGREQGATVAAPVFKEFMAAALRDTPGIPFRVPPGIRLARVNATTGRLAEPGEKNVILAMKRRSPWATCRNTVAVRMDRSLRRVSAIVVAIWERAASPLCRRARRRPWGQRSRPCPCPVRRGPLPQRARAGYIDPIGIHGFSGVTPSCVRNTRRQPTT